MNRVAVIAFVSAVLLAGACAKVIVEPVPVIEPKVPAQPAATNGTGKPQPSKAQPLKAQPPEAQPPKEKSAKAQPPGDGTADPAPAPSSPQAQAAKPLKGEGVFYALPRTVARVTVKADKEVTVSARFARFAPIFAPGIKPPCGTIVECAKPEARDRKTAYSLQQGATFSTFGEPDPSRVYMVRFTGGGAFDQSLSMAWNEAGLLSTVSASVTNRTTDIVMSGLKLATGLTGTAMAGSSQAVQQPTVDTCPAFGSQTQTPKRDNDKWIIGILLLIDPKPEKNPLVANYCDLPPADRTDKDENSRDDFDLERDQVELSAAVRAYGLRAWPLIDRRSTMLTVGGLNVLEPVKLIDKLDTLIDEELKVLFGGTKTTDTWDLPFDVRKLAVDKLVDIIGLDVKNGVCPESALLAPDAKPMPDGFQGPKVTCTEKARLSLDFHPQRSDQLFARIEAGVESPDDPGAKPEKAERSFRYILPAQVKAQLTFNDANYGTAVFSVAQFGKVVSLPAKRHSKTITYDLAMVEATGGLKSFKLGTTGGLDAATIDALAGVGGSIFDIRSAERKEAQDKRDKTAAAADEVALLTRQQTILKLKDEICELQKKNGLACTVQ